MIKRRLLALRGAPTLASMDGAPGRLHQLTEDRDEQFALDLRGPVRLIFKVNDDPIPRLDDGGIERAAVTKVEILEVDDYHGK